MRNLIGLAAGVALPFDVNWRQILILCGTASCLDVGMGVRPEQLHSRFNLRVFSIRFQAIPIHRMQL
jgi:hypothetical protein